MESAQFARPGNDECRDDYRWLLARLSLKLVLLLSNAVLVIVIKLKTRARKPKENNVLLFL